MMNAVFNLATVVAENPFSTITSDMIRGLYDGILYLIPVMLPPVIGFIGIKKGIGFLFGGIKKA